MKVFPKLIILDLSLVLSKITAKYLENQCKNHILELSGLCFIRTVKRYLTFFGLLIIYVLQGDGKSSLRIAFFIQNILSCQSGQQKCPFILIYHPIYQWQLYVLFQNWKHVVASICRFYQINPGLKISKIFAIVCAIRTWKS